ncbi:putative phage abortive infection protein [Paralysiella testudinis]|uniref:Uncharacterized protein n=1 Tax=Paralysiella testudinis TaxID=2809020 RepID=A0A892ZI89_9NEIS|nr:putative phage abortive infection protein [Paralysiella testudinis]QRQ82363.1 hypothetical protein JQU52_02845 [Paralysiella testudinis]
MPDRRKILYSTKLEFCFKKIKNIIPLEWPRLKSLKLSIVLNIQKEIDKEEDITKLFILIFQMLKFIYITHSAKNNTSDCTTICIDRVPCTLKEKQYSNILRACLSSSILQLLAINCYRPKTESFAFFQKLIERYALLEHMPLFFIDKNHSRSYVDIGDYDSFLIFLTTCYKPSAFDKNEYLKAYLRHKNLEEIISNSL